jgi:3-hydroxyacyl-[acyl-carrier-protein] dehydratase
MRLEYFQLIDRVLNLSLEDRTITAEAMVPATSTIFEGHFPGHPLMPGVLLVEAMAQASGWLVIALTGFERMPFLAQIKEAKLRSFVLPNRLLTIEAEIAHEGSGFVVTRTSITDDGKRVCESELTFSLTSFPSTAFEETMKEAARRVALPMGLPASG